MHEFLRRAITSTGIKGDSGCSEVVTVQIKLLNCVGMMYCGCDELSQAAKSYHRDLVDFCCYEWKASNDISSLGTTGSNSSETDQAKVEWKEWYDAESIRRTGYCIWLLDCMWYFHFRIRPSLSLDDGSVLLPCQEVLWEAESAIDWKQLLSCSSTSPTLHHALQRMYTEKRLQSSMGEFSRILLIHGLFRRTWEVESYLKQPLTQWTPTAQQQTLHHLSTTSSIWLPAYRHIPTGATQHAIAWTSYTGTRTAVDAFYEARAVYLATLVLWAYGLFAVRGALRAGGADADGNGSRGDDMSRGRRNEEREGGGGGGDDDDGDDDDDEAEEQFNDFYPRSMQLDRPADDELVQLFVKRGQRMKALVMGVGNLCQRNGRGASRVLGEGRKLLGAGKYMWGLRGCWGIDCGGYKRRA
ncbi:hypothetical protein EYC84_007390 [Monilinia fructicola]|uniref:Xylanolytic transcriptional activator regulatory domain-containing protein n=1 Tax=Monilinia fructicola TaxID=38448 RepID=A0A5M9JG49_MONFR|nr:hypothetical protein EYC84_007390 [Monilinia fructicola]